MSRPPRSAALALTALLLSGCGTTAPSAAAAPTTSPPAATPSPSPTVDPACSSEQLRTFLADIDSYTTRGAFDVKPKTKLDPEDVYKWRFSLPYVEGQAEFQVYKAALKVREAVESWTTAEPDSLAREITTATIQITAKTLAMECRVHTDYAFAQLD